MQLWEMVRHKKILWSLEAAERLISCLKSEGVTRCWIEREGSQFDVIWYTDK